MPTNFRVIRVHGRVTWEFHGPGDDPAALVLKRRANQNLEQLDLAEYARDSSSDGVTTVEFDFKPDEQNPFWQRGAAGRISFYNSLKLPFNVAALISHDIIARAGESLVLYYYVGDEECDLTFYDMVVRLDVEYFDSAIVCLITE